MRETIILQRCSTPRKITLPTRETFVATYERPSRPNLPRNVIDEKDKQDQENNEKDAHNTQKRNSQTKKTCTKRWKFFKQWAQKAHRPRDEIWGKKLI